MKYCPCVLCTLLKRIKCVVKIRRKFFNRSTLFGRFFYFSKNFAEIALTFLSNKCFNLFESFFRTISFRIVPRRGEGLLCNVPYQCNVRFYKKKEKLLPICLFLIYFFESRTKSSSGLY